MEQPHDTGAARLSSGGFVLRTGSPPPGINGASLHKGWWEASVSTLADIPPALDRLAQAMREAGYTKQDVFGVWLAAEEAVVNSIKHGHREDPSLCVRLGYLIEPHQVLVVVEDEGPGFCPDKLPDPLAPENLDRTGGRGLFLMRRYMTWVRHNERGNCVTMARRRS